MKYSTEDVTIFAQDSKGNTYEVVGFPETPFPKMWHTSTQLPNSNWKVVVEHVTPEGYTRFAHTEFTDENYKKYGFDKLEASVENPFKLTYDDRDLVEEE